MPFWQQKLHVLINVAKKATFTVPGNHRINRKTGLVSPQFHIKYDNNFDTAMELDIQEEWKVNAGFVCKIKLTELVQQRHRSATLKGNNISTTSSKRGNNNVNTIPIKEIKGSGELNRNSHD